MGLSRLRALAWDRREPATARSNALKFCVLAAYAVVGVVVVVYWVSVLVRDGRYSPAWDGWLVDIIEVSASTLCLVAAVRRPRLRPMALTLGLGLLAWALGDIALTIESLGGASPPVPSVADLFYLAFYPLTYVAAVLFMRSHLRSLGGPSWLDGLIAGLGAAALCAAFAFHEVLHVTGSSRAATITNLAYPSGDLVLFGLVAGGLAVVPGRAKEVWAILAAGMSIVAAGDVANLFQASSATSGFTNIVNDVAWPTGTLIMSVAPWWYGHRRLRSTLVRPRGFLLPGGAATCALAIILFAGIGKVDRVAVGLAAATLVVAGVRSALSIRELRSISQERHEQAITDELTGLRNRRYLADVLDEHFGLEPVQGDARPDLAFLFVDLDRFKEINDSFGHPAGDELLRQLGGRLRHCIRGDDVAVRLGGDEFGILLRDVEVGTAIEVAKRVTAKLKEPFTLRSLQAHIGASIGIAMAHDASSAAELLWYADAAMYRAKQARSGYALHGEGMVAARGIHLLDDLRTAIDQGQLFLHYQPLLDLHSSRIVGVEALLRWRHPELGMVPPLDFIPLAEDAGLIGTITEFVLAEALRQVAHWHAAGNKLSVSVNVSPESLLEPGFVEVVRRILGENNLGPEALVIEITESVVVRDFSRLRDVIEDLMSSGTIVSIDDFGAGATSLTYLTNLGGVGEMKLDRSFIAGLADKTKELELVRATIELGHAMGLRVVAEGIEDEATLTLIASLGCDLAQGYHISRPQPAADLAFRPMALA